MPVSARPPAVTAWADLAVRWTRGKLTVEKVERGTFERPTVMKRFVGRFEARVVRAGHTVDSVRFDFPLLADADAGNQEDIARRMQANVATSTRVRVPLPDGADAIVLVDTHGGLPVRVPLALSAVIRAAAAVAAPAPVPIPVAVPDGGAR